MQRGRNRATIKVPLEEYMQVRGECSLTKSNCYSWWNSKSENIWKPKLKNAKSRLRPARHTSFANILACVACLFDRSSGNCNLESAALAIHLQVPLQKWREHYYRAEGKGRWTGVVNKELTTFHWLNPHLERRGVFLLRSSSAVVTGRESFPCWSSDCLIKASVVFLYSCGFLFGTLKMV